MSILVRRVLAWFIDLGIIGLYALLLFGLTTLVLSTSDIIVTQNPILGQLIGLITLTIPVVLYFYLSEKSSHSATIGKSYVA